MNTLHSIPREQKKFSNILNQVFIEFNTEISNTFTTATTTNGFNTLRNYYINYNNNLESLRVDYFPPIRLGVTDGM